MEGIIGITPEIKKVEWQGKTKIAVLLKDGRTIICPVSFLPSAKKTPMANRGKARIINHEMFTWQGCPEVYHIEQLLGKEKDYSYRK